MCLAVPAEVVTCEPGQAVTDMQGNRVRVSTLLVPDVKVGDWVLVHAGFAIQQVPADEVGRTFAVLNELRTAGRMTAKEGGHG